MMSPGGDSRKIVAAIFWLGKRLGSFFEMK
jgi:hypothetical protein